MKQNVILQTRKKAGFKQGLIPKTSRKKVGYKIPIFLTNGHSWAFIDQSGKERDISGPFTQSDLKRRKELFESEELLADAVIDKGVVDRLRSRRIVKELCEHFSKGHRTALIQMATGTGKTRVAMALIKVLINANWIRNVLFVVDRTALANQAETDGFKRFFSEPVCDLRDGFSTDSRLYVSTVQTLMAGTPEFYRKFSSGFFDLIIFDEAHRSIYDKNNLIFKYFDAIKIGLTATPVSQSTQEWRDTFKLFNCATGRPTVEYSYEEAILDGALVDYRAYTIDTQNLSLGIDGATLTADLKDQLRVQEENPDGFKVSGPQFGKVFMDDKTNELIITEYMNRCYKSDEGLPCKTIFFCAGQEHANCVKKVFDRLFPHLSSNVQVITSEYYRAEDEVRRFKLDSEPRIALSVGMLDTGVDIPEVCNLVFVKPVYSYVRFWQMVGRGTRNLAACKHKEWLHERDKKDFLILDYKIGGHSNLEYHKIKPTKESPHGQGVNTAIFLNRANLLEKTLDSDQKKIITEKLMSAIKALDEDSFIVRERLPLLKKLKKNQFNLEDYVKELRKEVAPLMLLLPGTNPNVSSFTLNTEKLFAFILENKLDKIDDTRQYVQSMLENVLQKDSLSEIREKRKEILKAMQDGFWEGLTFADVEYIIKELAPLMKYYQQNPRKLIKIDAPDLVLDVREFEKEILSDEKLKEFIKKNRLIRKIRDGTGVTSPELMELEAQLTALKPEITIENVQRHQKIDYIAFLRRLIGLTQEYDPREMIEREFEKYIIESNHYNSKQLEFLELFKKVFSERKHVEIRDLASPPLSNEAPLDSFQITELKAIVDKCNRIIFR